MPQLAAEPAPSFAGLLASLTLKKKDPLDDLEPDVATLTYESALRAHARYRAEPAFPPPAATAPAADAASKTESAPAAGASSPAAPTRLEENRKRASVTLRLTQSECAQLQQRAAEAGLTVSAYLRSCTFEVESLRAQVKQALAELRAPRPASTPARPNLLRCLRLFAPHTPQTS